LNKLFFTEFEDHSDNPINQGVDAVFSSDYFQVGYNIFDVQADFFQDECIICDFLTILPPDSWIIIHVMNETYLTQCMNLLLNTLQFKSEQLICILRDRPKIEASKVPLNNILSIPKISNNDIFNAKLNDLRKQIQRITKPVKQPKVSASINLKFDNYNKNGYFQFEDRKKFLKENENSSYLRIDTLSEEIKKFLNELNHLLWQELGQKESNLHQRIFKSLSIRARMDQSTQKNQKFTHISQI